MPVRWRLSDPAMMDHPRVITPGGQLTFSGRGDRMTPLAEKFRRLGRRRLVITGGPRSGKTTLAVRFEPAAGPDRGELRRGSDRAVRQLQPAGLPGSHVDRGEDDGGLSALARQHGSWRDGTDRTR